VRALALHSRDRPQFLAMERDRHLNRRNLRQRVGHSTKCNPNKLVTIFYLAQRRNSVDSCLAPGISRNASILLWRSFIFKLDLLMRTSASSRGGLLRLPTGSVLYSQTCLTCLGLLLATNCGQRKTAMYLPNHTALIHLKKFPTPENFPIAISPNLRKPTTLRA